MLNPLILSDEPSTDQFLCCEKAPRPVPLAFQPPRSTGRRQLEAASWENANWKIFNGRSVMKIQKNDNQGPSMSELIKSVPLLFLVHFLGWELGRSNLVLGAEAPCWVQRRLSIRRRSSVWEPSGKNEQNWDDLRRQTLRFSKNQEKLWFEQQTPKWWCQQKRSRDVTYSMITCMKLSSKTSGEPGSVVESNFRPQKKEQLGFWMEDSIHVIPDFLWSF